MTTVIGKQEVTSARSFYYIQLASAVGVTQPQKKFDTNTFANCRNLDFEKILEVDNSYYGRIDNCVYDCYSLACQVADKLNAYEEQKVKEHNKKFGTNYELPDKPKYDPKSN